MTPESASSFSFHVSLFRNMMPCLFLNLNYLTSYFFIFIILVKLLFDFVFFSQVLHSIEASFSLWTLLYPFLCLFALIEFGSFWFHFYIFRSRILNQISIFMNDLVLSFLRWYFILVFYITNYVLFISFESNFPLFSSTSSNFQLPSLIVKCSFVTNCFYSIVLSLSSILTTL